MLRKFESNGLSWLESGGGPLLLIPGEYLSLWEGIDPPTDGRQIVAKSRWNADNAAATDHDRACDVADYLGLIDIGDGNGLILGDEPLPTAWLPDEIAFGGILVRWVHAESEQEVL